MKGKTLTCPGRSLNVGDPPLLYVEGKFICCIGVHFAYAIPCHANCQRLHL
jgi:hypothetical protein